MSSHYSIAIYKDVFCEKEDHDKSQLQMVLRTMPQIGTIEIESFVHGNALKSLFIGNEESLHLVTMISENDEEDHYMVIYKGRNKEFPISLEADPVESFKDACILKEIIPNEKFWKQVWSFLTTHM